MRRPDFLRAEEVKRQKEIWAQEERIRDLVWRQNEEVHRALQEAHEENEMLRQENALLREDLANAEKEDVGRYALQNPRRFSR